MTKRSRTTPGADLAHPALAGTDKKTERASKELVHSNDAAAMMDELAAVIVDEIIRLRDEEKLSLQDIGARLQRRNADE